MFSAVPQSGLWQSALLLDGNVGIGGDIGELLGRCGQLVAPQGTLLVEVEPDDDVDIAYRAVLEAGGGYRSDPFRGRGQAVVGWNPGRRPPAGG